MPYHPAQDPFSTMPSAPSIPARRGFVVTPSDSQPLVTYAKALRVYVPSGTATLRVTPVLHTNDNDTITLSFTAGVTIEPLSVRQVWSTGTSAGLQIHAYSE